MKRRNTWKLAAVAVLLGCGVFVGLFWSLVPISNKLQWTCAKTGSQKGEVVYLGLIHAGEYDKPSELELFMIDHGHTNITHEWVKTMGTERYLLQKTHRHSKAPATYHFRYVFGHFIESASDQDKQRMVEVFLTGPEDAREAFLQDAEKVAFGNTEPGASGNRRPASRL